MGGIVSKASRGISRLRRSSSSRRVSIPIPPPLRDDYDFQWTFQDTNSYEEEIVESERDHGAEVFGGRGVQSPHPLSVSLHQSHEEESVESGEDRVFEPEQGIASQTFTIDREAVEPMGSVRHGLGKVAHQTEQNVAIESILVMIAAESSSDAPKSSPSIRERHQSGDIVSLSEKEFVDKNQDGVKSAAVNRKRRPSGLSSSSAYSFTEVSKDDLFYSSDVLSDSIEALGATSTKEQSFGVGARPKTYSFKQEYYPQSSGRSRNGSGESTQSSDSFGDRKNRSIQAPRLRRTPRGSRTPKRQASTEKDAGTDSDTDAFFQSRKSCLRPRYNPRDLLPEDSDSSTRGFSPELISAESEEEGKYKMFLNGHSFDKTEDASVQVEEDIERPAGEGVTAPGNSPTDTPGNGPKFSMFSLGRQRNVQDRRGPRQDTGWTFHNALHKVFSSRVNRKAKRQTKRDKSKQVRFSLQKVKTDDTWPTKRVPKRQLPPQDLPQSEIDVRITRLNKAAIIAEAYFELRWMDSTSEESIAKKVDDEYKRRNLIAFFIDIFGRRQFAQIRRDVRWLREAPPGTFTGLDETDMQRLVLLDIVEQAMVRNAYSQTLPSTRSRSRSGTLDSSASGETGAAETTAPHAPHGNEVEGAQAREPVNMPSAEPQREGLPTIPEESVGGPDGKGEEKKTKSSKSKWKPRKLLSSIRKALRRRKKRGDLKTKPEKSEKKPEEPNRKHREPKENPEESLEKPEESQEKPEESQKKSKESQWKQTESQEKPEETKSKSEKTLRKPEVPHDKPKKSQKKPEEPQEKPKGSQKKSEGSQKKYEESQKISEESQLKQGESQEKSEESQLELGESHEKPKESERKPLESQNNPKGSQEKSEESEKKHESHKELRESKIKPEEGQQREAEKLHKKAGKTKEKSEKLRKMGRKKQGGSPESDASEKACTATTKRSLWSRLKKNKFGLGKLKKRRSPEERFVEESRPIGAEAAPDVEYQSLPAAASQVPPSVSEHRDDRTSTLSPLIPPASREQVAGAPVGEESLAASANPGNILPCRFRHRKFELEATDYNTSSGSEDTESSYV